MQFVIACPVDGPVEVSIEDIDTVVIREPEDAEVIFTCPECGSEISVTVRIPSFLMAAIEAMATEDGSHVAPLASLVAMAAEAEGFGIDESVATAEPDRDDQSRIDAYCEYFRRQLEGIDDVEGALKELGLSDA